MKTAEEWAKGYPHPETKAAFAKTFREIQKDVLNHALDNAYEMNDEFAWPITGHRRTINWLKAELEKL